MTNLLQQAIDCNDGDRAVKIIQDALGIESDDIANYCFPQTWPDVRHDESDPRVKLARMPLDLGNHPARL